MADVVVTPANVLDAGTDIERNLRAGETLLAGQPYYVKSADGKAYKAQCDGTEEEATVAGVTVNGAAAGQRFHGQTGLEYTVGGAVVPGTEYILSNTAGGIKPKTDAATGERYSSLGYATTTTKIKLNIQNTGLTFP